MLVGISMSVCVCVFVSANNYEPIRLYGCVVIGETVCLAACPSVRVCLWVFLRVCVCVRECLCDS